jgi:hypothetical protein
MYFEPGTRRESHPQGMAHLVKEILMVGAKLTAGGRIAIMAGLGGPGQVEQPRVCSAGS